MDFYNNWDGTGGIVVTRATAQFQDKSLSISVFFFFFVPLLFVWDHVEKSIKFRLFVSGTCGAATATALGVSHIYQPHLPASAITAHSQVLIQRRLPRKVTANKI